MIREALDALINQGRHLTENEAAAAMEILMPANQATVSSAHVAFTDAKVAMRRICCPMHVTVAMSDPDCPS